MRSSRLLVVVTACLFSFHFATQAQNAPDDGWFRVQTDNGEFSIEVPDEYSYFFDGAGFMISENRNDYPVREMNLLNAYREGTLLSVETYRADAGALTALLNVTLERGSRSKKTRFNGIEVREVIRTEENPATGDKFYFVSRYFRSKGFVYVVSALSREEETPTMTRFFQSFKLDPGVDNPIAGVTRLGELKGSRVDIKDFVPAHQADKTADQSPGIPPKSDPTQRAAVIASKARASYVRGARDQNVTGAVRLRMVLNEKGYIPSIEVVKGLPEGLTRQAIFAALRTKFLPAEKGGKPIPVRKTLEYTFSIY